MTQNLARIGLSLAIVLALSVAASAVPFDATPDQFDLRPDTLNSRQATNAASAATSPDLADSNFALCLKGAIQIGPAYGGTNCWGWFDTTDGTEYAIMGVASGVAFVNTATMQVVDIVPGPASGCGNTLWREIKSYRNYCYAVSECTGTNQGMMIMDMSYLPDSVKFVRSYSTATDIRAHAISIDTVKGFAYLVKQDYSGFRVISLANPTNPFDVKTVVTNDLHDMTAHNDTVWAAEANLGSFSVWNLTNKNSPQLIQRVTIPSSGYVHNLWPTADRRYLGSTEETSFKTVKLWDIQDLQNISLVGEYLGPSNLAHNIHMHNGKAFLSHYESGISVLNMADPTNPTEIGQFDTYLAANQPQFAGCWGIFPHTRTGRVFASNMDGRLFVFNTRSEQLTDTLKSSHESAQPGEQVAVDISVQNDVAANGFLLPINWTGPYGMILDSISTQGLRTSYFEEISFLGYDDANSRIAVQMKTSSFGTSPDLPPGSGPVLRVHFTVPSSASGDSNQVRLAPYIAPTTLYPSIMTECFTLRVPVVDGAVTLGPAGCCVNLRGNVDGSLNDAIDISDLSTLISYLVDIGGSTVLPCPDEANINGSGNGVIDISDLSLLITYLTGQGTVLPACP